MFALWIILTSIKTFTFFTVSNHQTAIIQWTLVTLHISQVCFDVLALRVIAAGKKLTIFTKTYHNRSAIQRTLFIQLLLDNFKFQIIVFLGIKYDFLKFIKIIKRRNQLFFTQCNFIKRILHICRECKIKNIWKNG